MASTVPKAVAALWPGCSLRIWGSILNMATAVARFCSRSTHHIGVILFASLGLGQAQDQSARIDWLSRKVVPIRSIDPTIADDDFADLKPLMAAIGKSRVVVLGEQSHGDGATFLAKGRLIKFLHQKIARGHPSRSPQGARPRAPAAEAVSACGARARPSVAHPLALGRWGAASSVGLPAVATSLWRPVMTSAAPNRTEKSRWTSRHS